MGASIELTDACDALLQARDGELVLRCRAGVSTYDTSSGELDVVFGYEGIVRDLEEILYLTEDEYRGPVLWVVPSGGYIVRDSVAITSSPEGLYSRHLRRVGEDGVVHWSIEAGQSAEIYGLVELSDGSFLFVGEYRAAAWTAHVAADGTPLRPPSTGPGYTFTGIAATPGGFLASAARFTSGSLRGEAGADIVRLGVDGTHEVLYELSAEPVATGLVGASPHLRAMLRPLALRGAPPPPNYVASVAVDGSGASGYWRVDVERGRVRLLDDGWIALGSGHLARHDLDSLETIWQLDTVLPIVDAMRGTDGVLYALTDGADGSAVLRVGW